MKNNQHIEAGRLFTKSAFKQADVINLVADAEDIGDINNGFYVKTTHKEIMDCIARAKQSNPDKRREMLAKAHKAIINANAFFDDPKYQSMVGNSQAWSNLMADVLIYMCYSHACTGVPLKIVADSEFMRACNSAEATCVDSKYVKTH